MNIPGWSEEMMKSWTDAQQNYWSNLMSMSGNAAPNSTVAPGWTEAMEKWWSVATPQMPVQASELMSRVFEMSKVYTRLAENALAAASGSESKNVLEDWMDAMEKGFQGLAEQGKVDFSGFGQGNQVIEGWQQVMDSLGMGAFKSLSEIEDSLPGSAMWQEQLKKVLSLSGVGEHIPQHNQKLLEELSSAYQAALRNYMEAFSGQGLASVQALRERTAQLSSEGMSISSLRELYDLWVDVSEEVYQKFAFSDEYQKVYGEMVNSFVALKGALDTVRDSQLQALHILTTGDLDKVLKKQHEVVQENADLQEEVQELKEQVAAMATEANNKAAEEQAAAEPEPAAQTVEQTESAAEQAEEAAESEVAAAEEVAASAEPAEEEAEPETEVAASEPEAVTDDKQPDDLTKIKGLGPKMQEKLIDAGIQTFDQLAALSDDQAQELDKQMDARGRLVRDKWVAQAAELSAGQLA